MKPNGIKQQINKSTNIKQLNTTAKHNKANHQTTIQTNQHKSLNNKPKQINKQQTQQNHQIVKQ
jgi:hypothetical protein